jgi:hypothetical protein
MDTNALAETRSISCRAYWLARDADRYDVAESIRDTIARITAELDDVDTMPVEVADVLDDGTEQPQASRGPGAGIVW